MARYRLRIEPSAAREIEAVATKADRRLVIERFGRLADAPRPCGGVKLNGGDLQRVRQGRYRISDAVRGDELVVLVVPVGERRDV